MRRSLARTLALGAGIGRMRLLMTVPAPASNEDDASGQAASHDRQYADFSGRAESPSCGD